MGRGAQNGGRGEAHKNNNSNTYGNKNGGGNRTTKLGACALGLVSPLGGGTVLGALNGIYSTVGLGGLGGLPQQQTQLQSMLGGCTSITGGV